MNKQDFEKELQDAVHHALHYATDFYEAKGKDDYQKLYLIKPRDFIRKCYEGFKIAQKKILANLLDIEAEIKIKKTHLNKIKKGEHKIDISNNPEYQAREIEISDLEIQRRAFQDIAGVIVWTIFLQQRTDIKSFVRTGGGSGYLIDRNIDSVIQVAEKLNQDPDKFTLINDITPSLHVGDLVTVGDGAITVTEVKQKTDVNDLVSEIIFNGLGAGRVDVEAMRKLHQKSPKYGFGQLKRFLNQIISFAHTQTYIDKDEGHDPNFKKDKKATTIWTQDRSYVELVNFALSDFSKTRENYVFLASDCCIVGIFKGSHGTEFVKRADFEHYLYHVLSVPIDQCEYIKKEQQFSEFEKYYKKFTIYDLREKMFSVVTPLFLTLDEKHVLDILTNKVSVYIYFDHNHFFDMCIEQGLKPKWLSAKDVGSGIKQHLPSFENRYLEIADAKSDNKLVLGFGLLFKIVFDFQFGYNFIEQIKEDFWIRSHPKIGKIRHMFYIKKNHFIFACNFYVRRFFSIVSAKLRKK